MKWISVEILTPEMKKDRLGNNIETGEYLTIYKTRGRYVPWAYSQTDASGRTLTKSDKEIIIPPADIFSGDKKYFLRVEQDSALYKVEERKEWSGRWIILKAVQFYANRNHK